MRSQLPESKVNPIIRARSTILFDNSLNVKLSVHQRLMCKLSCGKDRRVAKI
jgi:hypothetical protein